jgi:hypothetical protein
MRKLFLTLIFVLLIMKISAQNSEHLSFKGVPINGTLNEYVSKMTQNGFTHIQTENGTAILSGDFAGYKDCTVGVTTLKQKDLIYKIVVIFSDQDSWSKLSTNYFELKEMLTQKYGKPTNVVEKFDGDSQPNEDRDRMHEVKFDNCKYYSVWRTDKGEIQLSIDHNSVISCFVKLLYFDKINSSEIKAKAIDDL